MTGQRTNTPLSSPISEPSVDTFGFGTQRSNTTSPTTLSPSNDSNRWSDLIPPKTALTFAVMWDPEDDLVAFSGAQLLDASTHDESKLSPSEPFDSQSQSYSQILTLEPGALPESENTAVLAFFRDNYSFLFSSRDDSPMLDRLRPDACRTQASSTLDGLDVYLRGSLLNMAHHPHRFYSCLENLDTDFQFDPTTSFARMWMEGKETESLTDEGFFETEHHDPMRLADGHAADPPRRSASQYITLDLCDDDTSSDWSTIDIPETPPLGGLLHGDQERPRTIRRLRKRRPHEVPVPPLVVLRRHQYNHDIPPPISPAPLPPSKNLCSLALSVALPKIMDRLKRIRRSSDTWVCVEIAHEITQHEV